MSCRVSSPGCFLIASYYVLLYIEAAIYCVPCGVFVNEIIEYNEMRVVDKHGTRPFAKIQRSYTYIAMLVTGARLCYARHSQCEHF